MQSTFKGLTFIFAFEKIIIKYGTIFCFPASHDIQDPGIFFFQFFSDLPIYTGYFKNFRTRKTEKNSKQNKYKIKNFIL